LRISPPRDSRQVLKTAGKNQWAKNCQLTFWIGFWLLVFQSPGAYRALAAAGSAQFSGLRFSLASQCYMQVMAASAGALAGVTPLVWVVTCLQGLKCLLVPATLKYADNLAYAYVKPAAILLTAVAGSALTGPPPSAQFSCGAALVMASMWLYNRPGAIT